MKVERGFACSFVKTSDCLSVFSGEDRKVWRQFGFLAAYSILFFQKFPFCWCRVEKKPAALPPYSLKKIKKKYKLKEKERRTL